LFPTSGFRLGRVFGIEIRINFTWLFIFVLVGFSFGDLFREWSLAQETINGRVFPGGAWPWVVGFITAAAFFGCLLMHELSHSYVAKKSGIKIERITLFLFGGVAEMGEDVRSPGMEFLMAIAGPVMTFCLAGVFLLLRYVALRAGGGPLIWAPLDALVWVNIAIGIFNLLPGFPLDGGRVLRSILWRTTGDLGKATHIASLIGQGIAVLIGVGGIVMIFYNAMVGGFWFILIGVFLFTLSKSSYRQTLFRIAASDTRVRDIMYTDIPRLFAGTTLTSLRHNYFAVYRLPAFPVYDGDDLVGIVTRDDLAGVAASEWDVLNAGRIARSVSPDIVVEPDMPLDRVMKRVLSSQGFLLVMERDQVLGILTREEMLRYVEIRLKTRGRDGGEAA